MGKHGSSHSASHWDTDWEAAITPGGEDSLYGSSDGYQAVNDWSGVYEVQPPAQPVQQAQPAHEVPAQNGFYETGASYDYGSSAYGSSYQQPTYTEPVQQQPVMDQSYYESVYAAYAMQQEVTAAQPHFQAPDPYAQYAQPVYEQPVHTAPPMQPQYEEQHNFHHPDFDTGQFEAIYDSPGSTEASYDLLPDGEDGGYDADTDGYDPDNGYFEYSDEYDEFDDGYRDGYDGDDLVDNEPEEMPMRSRSRSATVPHQRPFGTKPTRTGVQLSGRRTLHAITSTPAAVVGVAAVAVAAVGGLRLPSNHTETAADAAPATPTTNALEQNLLQMRAASANLADRATRSEQRSELAQQQALEKQRLAEMAPKYFLPVQDYILTAGFGDAGARWASLHTGQDFAVPSGTKVVSVTDGTVIEAGWAGAFGYRIVVQHPDGSETWYCHLSVMKVRSGKVAAGQIIALSGDTGNSTGPHLHFEYHPPGTPDPMNGVPGATTAVNPIPFLKSHGLLA